MEVEKIDLEQEVMINDILIDNISWKKSTEKHFIETRKYLLYIVSTLDGVKKLPAFDDPNGTPYYKTASATTTIIPEYASSRFRDSCFRIYENEKTIEFFHLGYIKNEKKYISKIKEINERKNI